MIVRAGLEGYGGVMLLQGRARSEGLTLLGKGPVTFMADKIVGFRRHSYWRLGSD